MAKQATEKSRSTEFHHIAAQKQKNHSKASLTVRYHLIPSLHSRASNQIFLFMCLLKLAIS